ncbi:helix-turn-helix domain-containing protein [Rhodoplanes serenus]|uniref:helix-turn-helix domain-containing protein n=1 Tax=Rhodoplanes serenus TaxID=200615 RepID=UPI001FDF525A|nr:XRE family transcriptional regulator [Rhodoplanes serenus]
MLRLARQRLGFTQKAAAARLGVVQPVLSRMENGVLAPDSALLMKASQVYQVPADFFEIRDPVYGPPVSVHPMTRGKSDITARELEVITAELNIRLMHLSKFLEGVDYKATADIPALDIELYGSPEKIAGTVRAHWGIPSGPIKNLTQLAERAGIVIGFSEFGGASVSGVTFRVAGRPPLILLNRSHPADRMRFTLAHEIGHLVMHRFPTESMEPEANAFASALLMPEADIRPAFLGRKITLELLAALKPEWRVAMQALLMRASALKFVTPNQSRYLWQQISSRGWRLREPAELDFAPEIPRVMHSIISAHLTDLGYSLAELSKLVRLHESEFTNMYGAATKSPPQQLRPRLQIIG